MKQKKRRPLLSRRDADKLKYLMMERLHPWPPWPLQQTEADERTLLAALPDAWVRRYLELKWGIIRCIHEREEEEPARERVEVAIEEIIEEGRAHIEATLDFGTREFEPEKRRYIAQEVNRRFPPPASPNTERGRLVAIKSIKKAKDFLCKNGLGPGEADELIAKALGKTTSTFQRRTLQQAK
jgi:hypothetical protein